MKPNNSTTELWSHITYITVEVVIGLCAVVGNMLVIWVVKLNPSLRTTTFYFIVSLALADIAVGVLVIPLAIVISLEVEMHFYACLFMSCVLLIFTHASIMSLLAIAVDRYLRVKLTVRAPEILPISPATMELLVLLSVALFSDAMVMDEKVTSGVELDTASATCNYDAHYKDHTKYWCRGYFRDSCHIMAFTPNSTSRVALRDTGSQLIITVSCLVKEDTGWYWCGIQRDFARDDMDFTQLIVTDKREGHHADGFSTDPSGNRTRSCRASKAFQKGEGYRMSILIICILITGLGIIFITSHLSRGRRSQRTRGVTGKSVTRNPQASQTPSVVSIHLVSSLLNSSVLSSHPPQNPVFSSPLS
ncbi:adenosine receptor A3 isoform X2 [Acomys russatus]|uniref:adenosine receptor A3 isoform X2 n=1 Tax=Acomys russatus TaxID=60746 RepID=UPI0021E1C21E|nr:adenosine receptor A3 isoform X2 [Acomys russatus]